MSVRSRDSCARDPLTSLWCDVWIVPRVSISLLRPPTNVYCVWYGLPCESKGFVKMKISCWLAPNILDDKGGSRHFWRGWGCSLSWLILSPVGPERRVAALKLPDNNLCFWGFFYERRGGGCNHWINEENPYLKKVFRLTIQRTGHYEWTCLYPVYIHSTEW